MASQQNSLHSHPCTKDYGFQNLHYYCPIWKQQYIHCFVENKLLVLSSVMSDGSSIVYPVV